MSLKPKKGVQLLGESLFHFSLKGKDFQVTLKVKTAIYLIIEVTLIIVILKYVL
jgi:hypothetical protein